MAVCRIIPACTRPCIARQWFQGEAFQGYTAGVALIFTPPPVVGVWTLQPCLAVKRCYKGGLQQG